MFPRPIFRVVLGPLSIAGYRSELSRAALWLVGWRRAPVIVRRTRWL